MAMLGAFFFIGKGHNTESLEIGMTKLVKTMLLLFTAAYFLRGHPGGAQINLTVDVNAERHPIDPNIYGIAGYSIDSDFAKEIAHPVFRWGGDATTRYNWLVDSSNSGAERRIDHAITLVIINKTWGQSAAR